VASGAVAPLPWGSLGALVLLSAAIMGSPGPATISLVGFGSAYGWRRSLPYLAGIVAGTAAVLVAVACGVTALLLAVPVLQRALLVVSALYILWLAYHLATAPTVGDAEPGAAPSLSGGALLGVANPKAWVAIAAVFSSAHLAHDAALDAVAKTAVLTAMIVVINTTWLLAGSGLAPLLRDPGRARAVNVGLAVALVAATAFAVVH
jgi:threonine/homoserine/homoserine lactone efflux protein